LEGEEREDMSAGRGEEEGEERKKGRRGDEWCGEGGSFYISKLSQVMTT